MKRFEAGGHSWWVEPGLVDFVRDVLAPAAREPERLAGAQVVKRNRVRTVVRVAGPGGAGLYAKRFRVVRPLGAWIDRGRGSAARRERDALLALRAGGLRCPQPLALGEERGVGRVWGSLLVTREVPAPSLPAEMDRLRAAPAGRPARAELMARLADAVFALFRADVDQRDLHVGNFLVPREGPLVLLDVNAVGSWGRRPGASARRERLVQLAHSLGLEVEAAGPAAREELAWFAPAYARLDPAVGPAEDLQASLLEGAAVHERRRLVRRGDRCLTNATGFVVDRSLARTVYRRCDVALAAVEAALGAPALRPSPGRRDAVEVAGPDGARWTRRELRERFLALNPREQRGLVAWRAAEACSVRGLRTPRALALVRQVGVSILLEEAIGDVAPWTSLLQGPPPARWRLLRSVGRLLGRLLAGGLTPRDLRTLRVVVNPADLAAPWVVDLEGLQEGLLSAGERARARAQVTELVPRATRTDRARLAQALLRAGGAEALGLAVGASWRDLARAAASPAG